MRHGRAIDLFIGDMALSDKAETSQLTYRRQLDEYADFVDPLGERDVREDTEDDCRRFLARPPKRSKKASPATLAQKISIQRAYFAFLEEKGWVDHPHPMAKIKRPRRQKPEYLSVTTTSGSDVSRLIFACENPQELICVGAAGYLGRRRAALARARRSDADLDRGVIRFTDKGGKVIEQPVPDEFLAVLRWADGQGVWDGPDDYLIPNRRKVTTNPKARSSKIVYETVKKVAKRAGVKTHVHALRAAFAVEYLESHPGEIENLKELLGHDRIETTMVYLRRMNRAKAMESVRDLSFGFSPRAVEAHTGFEPVLGEPGAESPLKAKLDELIAKERGRERQRH